jgi:hypothetical protein
VVFCCFSWMLELAWQCGILLFFYWILELSWLWYFVVFHGCWNCSDSEHNTTLSGQFQ